MSQGGIIVFLETEKKIIGLEQSLFDKKKDIANREVELKKQNELIKLLKSTKISSKNRSPSPKASDKTIKNSQIQDKNAAKPPLPTKIDSNRNKISTTQEHNTR